MTDLPVVLVWGLKAAPLLLGAWLATSLLRRGSAAVRHFVWVAATGGALALPLATAVAPRLEVALPSFDRGRAPAVTAEAPAPTGAPAAVAGDARTSPTVTTLNAGPEAAAPTAARASVAALVTRLWALGAALFLALVTLSLWRTSRLGHRARRLDAGDLRNEVERGARSMGIRRPVVVLEADGQEMPMTWGLARPRILLPAGFRDWPAARRRAVLLHELAHVRRWDWFTQLMAQLAGALYWWNPLVWVAMRRLHEERELACDDLVLAQGTVASAYAADLLEIARAFRARPVAALAAVAMARRSRLATRLLAVLDAARTRHALGRAHAYSGAVAAAAIVLPMAGLTAGVERIEPDVSPPQVAVDHEPILPSTRGVAQARSALLCDWAAPSGRNSSSTNIDDDRMMIQLSRDDCALTVRAQGDLTFADDDRDLTRIAGDGHFEIEERADRARRRVEIDAAGARLERRWFVDGAEQPYGDDARAWLGDALLVLMRRAGINAEARATRILQSRGEDALMAEIALLQTDHVAGQYYQVLFARGKLSAAQTARLLADAARRIESDHALGTVLGAVAARQPMPPDVQRAYVGAADGLESDHEHSTALLALLAAGSPDVTAMDAVIASAGRIDSDHARSRVLTAAGSRYPADRSLPPTYVAAVGGMDSDHERGQVLTALLERDRLSPADRAQVLGIASRIASDHTQSQVLLGVLADGPLDDVTRGPFFAAVARIDSDHSRAQVLLGVLRQPANEANTLAVLEAARGIASDHSKGEVLRAVAAQGPMNDRVRAAYLSVARTIDSTHERELVMRAAASQEI